MTRPFKQVIPVKFFYWSSQITTMSLELGLMIGGGYLLDEHYGTSPLFLLVGCGLGILIVAWQLYRLVQFALREAATPRPQTGPSRQNDADQHGTHRVS